MNNSERLDEEGSPPTGADTTDTPGHLDEETSPPTGANPIDVSNSIHEDVHPWGTRPRPAI
jgi:hypothetical protein